MTQDTTQQQALVERYAGIELGADLERELGISQIRDEVQPQEDPNDPINARLSELFAEQDQPSSVNAPQQEVVTQEVSKDDAPTDWLDLIARAEVDKREIEKPEVEVPQTEIDPEFADTFQKTFGFDAAELRDGIKTFQETLTAYQQLQSQYNALINEVQSIKATQTHQQQMNQLKQDWGIDGADFDARMQQVLQAYSKLPAHAQAKYGDAQGAKYIWNLIEQEQATKSKSVPNFDRGRGNTGNSNKPLTWAEIDQMRGAKGEKWYEANEARLFAIMQQQGSL